MVPAPVGFQCPACVKGAAAGVRTVRLASETVPYITYGLITANVLVSLLALATVPGWTGGALGSVGLRAGLLGGGFTLRNGLPTFIGVDAGEWYRLVSGAFVHAGPIHLGFNMLLLWQTGALLEPAFGRLRFAMLYTVALLGGSFGALLLAPATITVGASGAVFGLMGALFVAERTGFFGRARSSIGFLIVINLVLTVTVGGISIGGHFGGLATGSLVGWMFQEFEQRRLPPLVPVLVSAALGVTLFTASLWAATLWVNPIF